jgi:hypothetical protein
MKYRANTLWSTPIRIIKIKYIYHELYTYVDNTSMHY